MAGLSVGADLGVRTRSAVVMAVVVLLLAWLGGWAFALFSAILSAVILWEWRGIVRWHDGLVIPGDHLPVVVLVVVFGVSAGLLWGLAAMLALMAATVLARRGAVGIVVEPSDGWAVGGIAYAILPGLALALIRGWGTNGLWSLLFLFAVVWGTDIGAYFAGRLIGGPKLWPAVSPGKTRSGAVGGLLAAVAAGLAVAKVGGATSLGSLAALAIGLSIVSQAGDLAESWLKRRYAVKDSSHLIPGHGGVMDRVDGLGVAAVALAAVGALRPGGIGIGGISLW